MPLVLGGSSIPPVPYNVDNSCKFDGPSSDRLTSDFSGTGSSSAAIATYSVWVKFTLNSSRANIISGMDDTSNYLKVRLAASANGLNGYLGIYGESPACDLRTTIILTDPSAWYNIVMAFDTAQVTDTDRIKVWINGIQVTSFTTATYLAQDSELFLTKSDDLEIGAHNNTEFFGGYMAELVCIDGTALTASSFGEYDSASPTIWKPKDVSALSVGTKGYYLDFKDSAALGDDVSGNNNDFTEVNIAAIDQAVDSPTNNFATFNPLGSNSDSISEGNLYASQRAATDYSGGCATTIGVKKGKWYCEWKCVNVGAQSEFGIHKGNTFLSVAGDYEYGAGALYYGSSGAKFIAGSSDGAYGDSWTSGDIISVALDMDNRDLYFYKNGTIQNSGTAAFDSSDIADGTYYFPFAAGYNVSLIEGNFGGCNVSAISSGNADANGYGNFEYAVPSGYYALCTKNLDEFGG